MKYSVATNRTIGGSKEGPSGGATGGSIGTATSGAIGDASTISKGIYNVSYIWIRWITQNFNL